MISSFQASQETIASILEAINETIHKSADVSAKAVMEAQKYAIRTKLDCVILAPVVFLPNGRRKHRLNQSIGPSIDLSKNELVNI